MVNLLKVRLIATLLLSGLLLALNAWAEERPIGQVDQIDTKNRTLIIGDIVYSYTPFLRIQEYDGDKNQRLPFTRLSVGDWVVIKVDYSEPNALRRAETIFLLDNERQARQLIEQNI